MDKFSHIPKANNQKLNKSIPSEVFAVFLRLIDIILDERKILYVEVPFQSLLSLNHYWNIELDGIPKAATTYTRNEKAKISRRYCVST